MSSSERFNLLVKIAQGLKDIHQKNLVHRDFHSGNILKGIEQTSCLIIDLGLCKPVDQITQEEKIFGVLPYVAPEVLTGQPYTQASDIYSFAIVASELLTGLPPYYDKSHDVKLGIAICQKLRPSFNIKIPQLLMELIKRCWAADPIQRPTASEIEKTFRAWRTEIGKEFQNQLIEAETYNKTLSSEIRSPNYQIHRNASYHSKILPTKEITSLLQVFNSFQTKALELNTSLLEAKKTTQEVSMEKKYQDFKKAVDLIINKSTELEKIIDSGQLVISEDLKEKLTKIQELKAKAQNKNGVYQKIKQQKAQKEQELNILKSSIFSKYKELDKGDLEDILIDQDNAIKDNNEKNNEKLQRAKKRLAKDIDKEEVDQLCQLQSEITQLELQLNQNLENSTKELTQIINHITNNYGTNITGTVNISGGQTIMGGQNQGVNQTNNNNPLISGGDFTNATFSGDAFSSNNLEKYSSKEKKDNKKRAKRTSWEDGIAKRNNVQTIEQEDYEIESVIEHLDINKQ